MTKIIHDFKVGDKVAVTDHFSTIGTYTTLFYVIDIEADYYILKKRSFINEVSRIPKVYQYMKIG